jgi:hypothetical protein
VVLIALYFIFSFAMAKNEEFSKILTDLNDQS